MANVSHRLGEKQPASEIKSAVAGHAEFAQSVDRLLAHLQANEIDVDSATVTLGPTLEFDTETEQFKNNVAANHLVRREDRKPFIVPTVA